MASKPPTTTPLAGGALIAFGAIGGAVIGQLMYEAIPGLLIGTGIGVGISIAMWWFNTRA